MSIPSSHHVICLPRVPIQRVAANVAYFNILRPRQKTDIFQTIFSNPFSWMKICEFPAQWPVTRSFDAFFDLCLNKRLSKQSRRKWFEGPSRSLWRHCNVSHKNLCNCLNIPSQWIKWFIRALPWRWFQLMNHTSNGSWCMGIKGEMSGTVCVTFTWDMYIYIWVVYSLCFFCCLFITVTWWYVWCIEWASGTQEEVQACLVTLWLFIISCYSLYKTTLGLLCSWFENNPHFHKYSMDFHV